MGVVLFSVATTWFDTVLPVGYTLDHITETINDPLFVPTVGRSIIASLATIVVSVALMTPVMFLLHVAAPRARPLVEFLSLLPFALPTIVLALSLIRTYSAPPIVLSGTPTLLILAYVVTGLPFMYRALDNSLRAIDTTTLNEASVTLGALALDDAPAGHPAEHLDGLAAGALLVFSVSFGEFTLSSFIVGDAWKTSRRLDGRDLGRPAAQDDRHGGDRLRDQLAHLADHPFRVLEAGDGRGRPALGRWTTTSGAATSDLRMMGTMPSSSRPHRS